MSSVLKAKEQGTGQNRLSGQSISSAATGKNRPLSKILIFSARTSPEK
jgi:hypothetical protein